MLIITSDEDVIREFSSKKLKNTQIIDLDIHKHISFDDKSSLTQLTQHVRISFLNSFFSNFSFSIRMKNPKKKKINP